MRVRLWVPLPGPFAITSGRKRPRSTQPAEMGRAHARGWFFWPPLPKDLNSSGMIAALFWITVLVVAVAYNLIIAVVALPVLAARSMTRRGLMPGVTERRERETADIT